MLFPCVLVSLPYDRSSDGAICNQRARLPNKTGLNVSSCAWLFFMHPLLEGWYKYSCLQSCPGLK